MESLSGAERRAEFLRHDLALCGYLWSTRGEHCILEMDDASLSRSWHASSANVAIFGVE